MAERAASGSPAGGAHRELTAFGIQRAPDVSRFRGVLLRRGVEREPVALLAATPELKGLGAFRSEAPRKRHPPPSRRPESVACRSVLPSATRSLYWSSGRDSADVTSQHVVTFFRFLGPAQGNSRSRRSLALVSAGDWMRME